MIELESKKRIDALTAKANAVTGAADTQLAPAVERLIAGFGQGGGETGDKFNEYLEGTYPSGEFVSEVQSVRPYAFTNDKKVTSVILPNAKRIGFYSFQKCTALTTVSCPEATHLGNYAFDGCTNLMEVYLPKANCGNLDSNWNGYHVFRDCKNLKILSLPSLTKNIVNGMCTGCTALEEVYFPMLASELASAFFSGCTSLRIADLGFVSSLTSNNCLAKTGVLETLILRNAGLVPIRTGFGEATLSTTYTGTVVCTVYVPAALIEEYQNATNWSALYTAGRCIFAALEGSGYE